MNKRLSLGKKGENYAVKYLQKNGYKIIERNFKRPFGELDIISVAPDKTLVFVEVKTMTDMGESFISPENHITFSKIKKFKRVASIYVGMHEELINDKKGFRLDVITLKKLVGRDLYNLNHYKNIE